VGIRHSRRGFLQTAGAAGIATAVGRAGPAAAQSNTGDGVRRFHCVQIDVFTARRLQGNPLAVFTDARGLPDTEMQDLARETNLQETTFVFPRDPEHVSRWRRLSRPFAATLGPIAAT
jgi:Phenazine biosynthesis-like protein